MSRRAAPKANPAVRSTEGGSQEHVAHAAAFDGIAVSWAQHATALILQVRCKARTGERGSADPAQVTAQPILRGLHDRARALGVRPENPVRPEDGLSIDACLPLSRLGVSLQPAERRRHRTDRRKGHLR